MAISSGSRVSSGTPTLEQAFARLALLASPLLLLYLLGMGAVLALARDGWRMAVLFLALLGLIVLARVFGHWIVEVRPMTALVISRRDNHRRELLPAGFYIRPAVIFDQLATVLLYPSEEELKVQHVSFQSGPPLTVRVAYTLRPSLPMTPAILPRTHLGEAFERRDLRTIGYLLLASRMPERWQLVSSNIVERALRTFLGRLPIQQIYDPVSGALLEQDRLYQQLNGYLATYVEPELGFSVQVHAVEVLDDANTAALAWYQRWTQLQQLAGLTQQLTPEQALVMAELFERLAGTGGSGGGGMDPALYLLLSQIGYNGSGGENPPQGQPQGPPPPLRPDLGRVTGTDRPAA